MTQLLVAFPAAAQAREQERPLQAFASQAELTRYFAVLDSIHRRPTPKLPKPSSCGTADTTGRSAVITGTVRDSAGSPIANAQVFAVGTASCALAGADGAYRLVVPGSQHKGRRTMKVRAALIGYRSAEVSVTLVRRRGIADFTLAQSAVQLEEATVVTASASSAYGDASPVSPRGASITNTQHAGVDEGGIVKRHGDYLIVLRRGRLFTISLRGGELRPVAHVDAYAPGAQPAEWYDEMLVADGRVVVIGYGYRFSATEVNVFALDADGGLRHLHSSHLRSNDYYSARNYASRLVGGKLIFYTPLMHSMGRDLLASLPALRPWRPAGDSSRFETITTPRRVYRPPHTLAGLHTIALHTITTCDITESALACDATVVLGPWSRVFYVSPTAVYVWSTDWAPAAGTLRRRAMVYRLPLDGSEPGALAVAGSPTDQFSFLEADGHLQVLLRAEARGDFMWVSEWTASGTDSMALLRLPLTAFARGPANAPARWYRALPPTAPGVLQNRFVGDHLLYGEGRGWWHPTADSARFVVVPWREGAATVLGVPHAIDRIEVMGTDAVVIGSGGEGATSLFFSGVRLGARPVVAQRFALDSAAQGETRSHGFFYRPADQRSGVLGLPVRRGGSPGYAHLVEGSAGVLFLRNANRAFTRLGSLEANPRPLDDGCRASCVDWYGNARPIFLGDRIVALLGYELVEGAIADDHLAELRRVTFAPERMAASLRD